MTQLSDTEWEDPTDSTVAGYDDEFEAKAGAAGDANQAGEETEPQTYFRTLPEVIDQFLIYRRPVTESAAWCRKWWNQRLARSNGLT